MHSRVTRSLRLPDCRTFYTVFVTQVRKQYSFHKQERRITQYPTRMSQNRKLAGPRRPQAFRQAPSLFRALSAAAPSWLQSPPKRAKRWSAGSRRRSPTSPSAVSCTPGLGMLCSPMGMIRCKVHPACLCRTRSGHVRLHRQQERGASRSLPNPPAAAAVLISPSRSRTTRRSRTSRACCRRWPSSRCGRMATDAKLTIAFPNGCQGQEQEGGGAGGVWGVVDADGAKKFNIKSGCDCGKLLCSTPMMDNCKKGILQGNMCMTSGTPCLIRMETRLRTSCRRCRWSTGLARRHGPHGSDEGRRRTRMLCLRRTIARLALFMFAVAEHGPADGLPKGGPVCRWPDLPAMMLGRLAGRSATA